MLAAELRSNVFPNMIAEKSLIKWSATALMTLEQQNEVRLVLLNKVVTLTLRNGANGDLVDNDVSG